MSKIQTIDAAILAKRLSMILDDSCHKLCDLQDVISHYVTTGTLNIEQMEHLQNLDVLTQEIEAVCSVLKRMGDAKAKRGDLYYMVDELLADVRLSQVKHILNYGQVLDDKEIHGDVTFF